MPIRGGVVISMCELEGTAYGEIECSSELGECIVLRELRSARWS